jgi:small-conductance mechanosensitive channel
MKKLFLFTCLLLCTLSAYAQDSLRFAKGAAVVIEADTLFYLHSNIGPFTATERAQSVEKRLKALVKNPFFTTDSLRTNENETTSDVVYGDMIITSVTDAEATLYKVSRQELAKDHLQVVQNKTAQIREESSLHTLLIEIGLAILALTVVWILIRLTHKVFNKLRLQLIRYRGYVKGLKINGYDLLTPQRSIKALLYILRGMRYSVLALIIYLAIPVIFSIFPWTKGLGEQLLGYVLNPLHKIIFGIFAYIPNLLTILVILVFTRYVVKFFQFISNEIEKGVLTIPGFYADWAEPSFKILRFLLYAFSFVVIFPYLPGSGSPIFQGVSVFIGILFSLGSSSAISNIVAGIVITYMRPFKIGQRVKIGDVVGDIVEKNMLVTKIRTAKNEDITLPNSNVLTGHTINYSSYAQDHGLIMHTTVTIGYDVPWRQVHQLLITAARRTEGIIDIPLPFVLQTSLDDYYVSYQVNAYTREPNRMASIYSELFQHIQDVFNEAGVEIMSPQYQALRDGNQVTIPANYLQPDYKVPAFRTENSSPESINI